jgi:Outer membrane efflux protein
MEELKVMNLIRGLLTLALLGMDDPTTKPGLSSKPSVEIKSEADGQTAPEATPTDRILKRVEELEQVGQGGIAGSAVAKLLTREEKPRTADGPEAQEAWPITLRQAIMIGLDNSEIVRVISYGSFEPTSLQEKTPAKTSDAGPAPIVIAQLNADTSPWRFKNEVMAHVRSIEQQYWVLAFMQIRLWATDRAVSLAKEVLNKEQADLHMCRGTVADVAEAAQRLEQLQLELVTQASDVLTAERQLRNILGLPPGDNRRIIPLTPASEAKLEPVWDTCVNELLEQSPEIVEKKTAIRQLRDAVAIASVKVPVASIAAPSVQQRPGTTKDDPETRQQITHKETDLEDTIRQQVHSFARTFLNIDASDKQLRTAKRLKAAAAARLDAQRAYYAEGRITIDRFLDAISQYATAVATEAQCKATYNTSIVALKEAKGTLLEDYGIVVAEPRKRRKANQ